ncbi:MAG TPA: gephyrin-like molybdotransferase Glp [Xanthobacteraceae bacterium]|nr:gephyrin-like molybdotransferase Glp [Xanthobacteraceae bacterium]
MASPLLSVADALAQILEHATPLTAVDVPLQRATGRVLAADLAARRTQPPADMSAMDGYAVRAADVVTVPAQLKVIGEVAAGRPFPRAVGAGEAARIFTGGVLPDGTDTIVIQENTDRNGDTVTVKSSSAAGRHVRRAGLDFKQGDVLFPRGHRILARDLALIAGMNYPAVPVHRAPKVATFATGDELVPPGTTPGPGQIIFSNGYTLGAMFEADGADVTDLGIVPDRLGETVAAVRRARAESADVLVTTGGASVGEYDLVQKALAAEGMDLLFWKIAMRPGRPLMHGRIGPMHVLGLPGNPVSSYVCCLLFVLPLLRKLSGRSDIAIETESARLAIDLPANDEREDYLRSKWTLDESGATVVTPFGVQDSSMMARLSDANCLAIRAPFAPPAKAGDACAIVKLAF